MSNLKIMSLWLLAGMSTCFGATESWLNKHAYKGINPEDGYSKKVLEDPRFWDLQAGQLEAAKKSLIEVADLPCTEVTPAICEAIKIARAKAADLRKERDLSDELGTGEKIDELYTDLQRVYDYFYTRSPICH